MPVRGIGIAVAALVNAAAVWALWRTTGPDPVAIELASSPERFAALFAGASGAVDARLVEGARDQLRVDDLFVATYTAGLLLLIVTTGRRRPLGRRAPTTLAIGATVAAGVLDVLENMATSAAIDDLVAGREPDSGRVTDLAMAKWILLVAVGAYLLVRAFGTPRRRQTVSVRGRRYRLAGSRDDASVVEAAPEPAGARSGKRSRATKVAATPVDESPRAAAPPAAPPPGLLDQLRADPRAKPLAAAARGGKAFARAGAAIAGLVRTLFFDSPPTATEPPLEAAPGERDAPVESPVSTGRRIGIACSGGGVRSASFTLGALQVLRERGVLERASHVTAVSGGGYLAAGWAIAASRRPADARDVFAPGSPEERWLRRHTNLLPDIRIAVEGVARALFGMAVNLLLIWLVLMAASRPVGWLEHVVHPELQGREPYLSIVEQPSTVSAEGHAASDATCPSGRTTGSGGGEPAAVPALCFGAATDVVVGATGSDPVRAWTVSPVFEPAVVDVWDDSDLDEARTEVRLDVVPGLLGVVDGELTVIRQPRVRVPSGFLEGIAARASNGDPEVSAVLVARQPELRVVEPSVPDEAPSASQLRLRGPSVDQRSGTTGRPDLVFDGWMWWVVGTTGAAYALVGAARTLWNPVHRAGSAVVRVAAWVTGVIAVATTAVIVVLPWVVHTVPSAIARLVTAFPGPDTSAAQSSDATVAVAAGGAAVLTIATVVRTLRGPVVAVARRWPRAVAKVVVAVALVVVPLLLFVNSLAMATANGPGGHLIGLWASRVHFPVTELRSWSDITRWFAVLVVLAVWRNVNEAHALSLFPFYQRRMSQSFAIERRDDGSAGPVPYAIELAWATTDTPPLPAKGFGRFQLGGDAGDPELVLCATANTYRVGEAPSGRRSSPFTFSPTVVGGPDVGYVWTKEYLDALGLARRKDVTVPAALAISGAAFSPGMGKMSMGPIDNLLAVTNARLGVWVPHPAFVAEQRQSAPAARWRDKPGWPYFLREVLSLFRLGTPYLYVTDGGHWENLGLVELLRRGCRDVIVISAAGDGSDGFATIGEAIALAREELDLEIAIDLEPLRAIWAPPGELVEPPTLRRGADRSPLPVAREAYRQGVIRDLRSSPASAYGTIVVLEANLSVGDPWSLPWDVATWAEGHTIFPDDPTVDQNFSHRQFESYRRLGRFQMNKAFADPNVAGAFGVPAGPLDPATPP